MKKLLAINSIILCCVILGCKQKSQNPTIIENSISFNKIVDTLISIDKRDTLTSKDTISLYGKKYVLYGDSN